MSTSHQYIAIWSPSGQVLPLDLSRTHLPLAVYQPQIVSLRQDVHIDSMFLLQNNIDGDLLLLASFNQFLELLHTSARCL